MTIPAEFVSQNPPFSKTHPGVPVFLLARLGAVCNRYGRWISSDTFEAFSDLRLATEPLPVTYNAAPQSVQPIIRLSRETGLPEIVMAHWGLIPFWAKDPKTSYTTFNARSEELAKKAAFREPLHTKRCLIPANCFYEWQAVGRRDKQPYAFAMLNQQPFAFAGLWDRWRRPDGLTIESFTIITVPPNDLLLPIHNRMPCILEPVHYTAWLAGNATQDPPVNLLRPFDSEKMRCWRVGKAVGNTRNDSPDLILETAEPIPEDAQLPLPLDRL